jgi:hypothetical protein
VRPERQLSTELITNSKEIIMRTQSGNLLDITTGIVVHQVNCQGVMGAGLAKSLRSAYPIIFPRYQQFCRAGHLRPGMVQFVCVSDSLYVCNLAGQDGYGRDRCYTDYDAVAIALSKLYRVGLERSLPIYIPYLMGCSLGGGDWTIVSKLIDQHCPNAIVVKLA